MFSTVVYTVYDVNFSPKTRYIHMAFQPGAEVENKDLLFSTPFFSGTSSEMARIGSRFCVVFFCFFCFSFSALKLQTRHSRKPNKTSDTTS